MIRAKLVDPVGGQEIAELQLKGVPAKGDTIVIGQAEQEEDVFGVLALQWMTPKRFDHDLVILVRRVADLMREETPHAPPEQPGSGLIVPKLNMRPKDL